MTQGWVNSLNPNIKIQILICYPMCFQYEGTHSSFLKECCFPQNQLQIQAGKCGVGDTEGLRFISFGAFRGRVS